MDTDISKYCLVGYFRLFRKYLHFSVISVQIVPNLYEFVSSVEHKRRLFELIKVAGSHGLPQFFVHTMEVNGCHQLFVHQYSSKLLLCSTEKETHTGLKQVEDEE